jgi:predicted nucleic acid-binding protein
VIVVSDSSPLRYLAAIGALEWLPALFGEVICPPEVFDECSHPGAPADLRAWILSQPSWLRVVPVAQPGSAWPYDAVLDRGEVAALRLAEQLRADLVLIDERKGRLVAGRLGLAVTGTVGVVVAASLKGLADFEQTVALLRSSTNFRIDDEVLATARTRLAGQS